MAKEKIVKLFVLFKNKKFVTVLSLLLVLIVISYQVFPKQSFDTITLNEEEIAFLSSTPIAAVSDKKSTIAVPSGIVKANPFLPYRNLDKDADLNDLPEFDLVPPPEIVSNNSDAARVMDTIVSGILYDKYSPSAILNIEGNDYLVKKGDVVNNYHIISILKDSVTVKLGSNTYKAGIGEILTEGTLNYNEVSNLNNKFGGIK